MSDERKIEKFGVGNLYPDRNPPEFHFFRSECIEVEMSDGDGFTFTPFFNEFKDTNDLDKYLEKYIEDKKLEKLDIRMEHLKQCSYYINPETLELEDFIEGDCNYVSYWVWNNETKKLDEVDTNSLNEDEDEYEEEEEEEEEEDE